MKKQIIIVEIISDEKTRWIKEPRRKIEESVEAIVHASTEGTVPMVSAFRLPKGAVLTIREGDE